MLSTVAAVILAVVALLGAVFGGVAWFYRRGQQEQSLASSVAGLGKATADLATQVSKLSDKLDGHGSQLTDHEYRLRAGGL